MSYLSASENVGFSGVSQALPDGSCATQYKMAVDGVSENHSSGINMYIQQDGSVTDQTYITHPNDNFFQTKFKIDPNELYTFHDSDIVTSEITVGHTDDFYFADSVEVKGEAVETSNHEVDVMSMTNGDIKEEVNKVVTNGHYLPNEEPQTITLDEPQHIIKDTKRKFPNMVNSLIVAQKSEQKRPDIKVLNNQIIDVKSEPGTPVNPSISNVTSNSKTATTPKLSMETFLDVFKREQGLVESQRAVVKSECMAPPDSTQTIVKIPIRLPDKKPSAGKQVSQLKSRRGRGPAVHEALQRLPSKKRVEVVPNGPWHAPGDPLFDCGPLDDKQPSPFKLDSSSSDDDYLPDFGIGTGPACVEESAAETRTARLALRRAALRRHVTRAEASLKLLKDFKTHKALAAFIKKQLNNPWNSGNLPTQCVNHLLAMRGMKSVLTSQERRKLRDSGWSGGESGTTGAALCTEEGCNSPPVPCGAYCMSHVTLSEQRLYGVCGAMYADGARCRQPVLSVPQPSAFCHEHRWKRDNYDKLVQEIKPKPRPPTQIVRRRIVPASPRRAKRRRRLPTVRAKVPQPPAASQSLSELNVCSNSSTYDDSSEEVAMEGFGQNDFIIAAADSHELEVEVGHVSPDDILDPAVLSQIPDEAFTEFFNQAEGGASFAESSELTAALEAVLDERVLDDCVFTHTNAQPATSKIHVPTTISLGMSSGAHS